MEKKWKELITKKAVKGSKDKKAFWGKLLLAFFTFMLTFTVISRAASSVTVPKVKIMKSAQGRLSHEWSGSGTVKSTLEDIKVMPGNLLVEHAITQGSQINEGDTLIRFQMDALTEERDKKYAELEKLKLQLKQEILNGTPDAAALESEGAQRALSLAEQQYQRAQEELDEAIDRANNQSNASEAEITEEADGGEAGIKAAEQAVQQAWDALQSAQGALDQAITNDANREANQNKAAQSSEMAQQSIQIDIEEKAKQAEKLDTLVKAEGVIKADQEGIVNQIPVSAGSITTGQETIKIGVGGNILTAEMDASIREMVNVGDMIAVILPGTGEEKQVPVTQIEDSRDNEASQNSRGNDGDGQMSASGEDKVTLKASLEGIECKPGAAVSVQIVKESAQKFEHILPLQTVREDSRGKFCLAAEEKSTILGTEYIAVRIDLKELGKDDSNAAVSGPLTSGQKIIMESNKNIKEGDRLRIQK